MHKVLEGVFGQSFSEMLMAPTSRLIGFACYLFEHDASSSSSLVGGTLWRLSEQADGLLPGSCCRAGGGIRRRNSTKRWWYRSRLGHRSLGARCNSRLYFLLLLLLLFGGGIISVQFRRRRWKWGQKMVKETFTSTLALSFVTVPTGSVQHRSRSFFPTRLQGISCVIQSGSRCAHALFESLEIGFV